MKLRQYLTRIGFNGEPRADLATLRRIHRLHLAAIPYENLDVQLGRPVDFDLSRIFEKLVHSPRGGWCFEMNGLLAWALEHIGFRLTRLAGAVARDQRGDASVGTHLALCVHLETPQLVDVGFGDGIVEPIPIVGGEYRQDAFDFRLERIDDTWWRFHNQPHGGAPNFDFQLIEAQSSALVRQSDWLQTSPESGFVQNAVCQRYVDGELRILRGRVMKRIVGDRVQQLAIESVAQFEAILEEAFGIELGRSELDTLWARVSERHEIWLQARAART